MIPPIDPASGNLPPGIHTATWDGMFTRFGTTSYRRSLLAGLEMALNNLRTAGCRRVYIDGSFVTAKRVPGDYDVCWDQTGVDWAKLDPVFLLTGRQRTQQKAKYGGEFFITDAPADPFGTEFLQFFQTDKVTFLPKGIIAIDLDELP